MHTRIGRTIAGVLALGMVLGVAGTASAEERGGPFENIKVSPVAATWQYSKDGGKTFSDQPQPAPRAGVAPTGHEPKYPYAWKGAFEIADPSKVAGLWVRIFEEHEYAAAPRASICTGDLIAASGGYWKDLGFTPTLLDAVVKVNDKEVPIAHGPLLYFWLPLLTELKQGKNTIEMSGHVYTYWGGAAYAGSQAPVKKLDVKMIMAEAQPTEIYNGPILGDCGDAYFTLACRTQIQADLTVEATPVEPAGAAVTAVSKNKIWHRVKIEIPKGTRKVTYTLTAKVGAHETKRGPFTATLPAGDSFRFVAFGNVGGHSRGVDIWAANSKLVLKAAPALLVNSGNTMEQSPWTFNWEKYYTGPAGDLFAAVPQLVTPCNRDFTGIFNELHYTPAPDGYAHNWSKVIGPVRFIGVDGNEDWKVGNGNYVWLEKELSSAKEKFIVVLDGYPAYSSGINSKKAFPAHLQTRNVVLPLLGKHKASLMLCSWDPDYERIEPTPDKGVTQIVTGAIGAASWHKWDGRIGQNPFGPGPNANARAAWGKVVRPDGGEWVGYVSTRHFCVFDVTPSAMTMKVLACGGNAAADIKDLKVLDEKVFKPRQ